MHLRNAEGAARARPALRVVEADEHAPPREEMSRAAFAVAIGAAIVLGFMVRARSVLAYDFPLHDGGLFSVMAREIQASGYRLPAFTAYNSGDIPFAYPPLALYLAAALSDLTPLSVEGALRLLPLTASALMIPAFFLLARSMLSSKLAVAASVFAFALLPRTFVWMIMGGGLTRSFGLLFAILAVHQAYLMYTRRDLRFVASAAVFASLALLSHLQMAWFAAYSCGLLFAAYGRHRTGVGGSAMVTAAVLATTSPWWATVLARHGIETFAAAASGGTAASLFGSIAGIISLNFSGEPFFALIAALAVLGVVSSLASKNYVLPAWLLVCLVLDPRALGTVASVPLALLAGLGLADGVLPLVSQRRWGTEPGGGTDPAHGRGAAVALASLAVAYATLAALVASPALLAGLSRDERAAMQWVAEHTPADSRVLVVSGDTWDGDRTSEWFPGLTGRTSVVTPQGYEWVGGGEFRRRLDGHRDLQACALRTAACIETWSAKTGVVFDQIYLPKLLPSLKPATGGADECCPVLRDSLRADPSYEVVYDGPGATIFAVRREAR